MLLSTNILAIQHRDTALSRLQLQQKPAVTHKLKYYNRLPQCRIIILCQYRLFPKLGAIHLSLFTFRRRKMYLCKQSSTLLDCLHKYIKHTIQKVRVETVFLMMNPQGSKQAEDVKNRIKALI